ncbi:MAG: 2-isopropylmalate synthase [Nanobdellota archaeon]
MQESLCYKPEKVQIFDTTLRDGLQACQLNVFPYERLEIAKDLVELGVDVIEAGFATSSPGNYRTVKLIAKELGTNATICSLAKTDHKDIEDAARALEPAGHKRIHTFIATSDIHIEHKLRSTREAVLEKTVSAVEKAKQYTDDVEFSLEDFGRTDPTYAILIANAAIQAGATTINLPDTVGYLQPDQYFTMIRNIIDNCPPAIFSVHTHNDLGNATANTIAGLRAGARQAEVAMNNIGERAGNAALEEVVANLATCDIRDHNGIPLYTDINTVHTKTTSRNVERTTKLPVQATKPIVGANAFAHSSGIHQSGMLRNTQTYEIMKPEEWGVEGKIGHNAQSGRAGTREHYKKMGITLSDGELAQTTERLKTIADEVRYIDDADFIRALHTDEITDKYKLVFHQTIRQPDCIGTVVKLQVDNEIKTEYAEGNGPVDAAVKAIKQIIHKDYTINDFAVIAEGGGSDAPGGSRAIVSKNGWEVFGHGDSTDIDASGIKAYIEGCNRLNYIEEYFSKQQPVKHYKRVL